MAELVQWTKALKRDLVEVCNHVDRTFLSERMPDPYTEKDADWWLEMVDEHEGRDGIFRAILAEGKVIGNISIEQKADVYRKDAEIGYMLLSDFAAKGIMTEAVSKICKIAFSELDIIRITGLVYEPNAASRRVLEKNQFALEGMMKNAVYKNRKTYNLCVYGKMKFEEE